MLSVPFRPVASRFPWSDPLEIGLVIERLLDTIDPALAQNLNHDIVPGHTRNPSLFLEYLHPQFTFDKVIVLEPLAEIFRQCKGHDFRWIGFRHMTPLSLVRF